MLGPRLFQEFGDDRKDINGLTLLDRDEHMRPGTDMQALGGCRPFVPDDGRDGGCDAVAIQVPSRGREDQLCPPRGNSSGIVDGAAAVLVGSKAGGESMAQASRPYKSDCQHRFRSGAVLTGRWM